MSVDRRFEGSQRFNLEDEAVQENLNRLTLKMKALQCFETSVSVCRLATCENPEDLNLRLRCCQNRNLAAQNSFRNSVRRPDVTVCTYEVPCILTPVSMR